MKYSCRGGHNYYAKGASSYVDEVTEDRKINEAVIKYLRLDGNTVIDNTPSNMSVDSDLVYGVRVASENNVDVFISNHLNACYKTNNPMGCECVTYGDDESVIIANRVRDNLAALGFKRRENKINKELYETRANKMPSIIVEPFFVDSYADYQLYMKLGADVIGKAIAEGIVGHSIGNKADITGISVLGEYGTDKNITIVATTNDVNNTLFKYFYCKDGQWVAMTDWISDSRYAFTLKDEGNYRIVVHVKSKTNSTDTEEDYDYKDITVVKSKFPLALKMSENAMCYSGEIKSFRKGDKLTAMGQNDYSYIVVLDGVPTFIEKQFVKNLGNAQYPYESRILLEVISEPCRAWKDENRIYKKDDLITVRDEIVDYYWITPDGLSLYLRKNATTNR